MHPVILLQIVIVHSVTSFNALMKQIDVCLKVCFNAMSRCFQNHVADFLPSIPKALTCLLPTESEESITALRYL